MTIFDLFNALMLLLSAIQIMTMCFLDELFPGFFLAAAISPLFCDNDEESGPSSSWLDDDNDDTTEPSSLDNDDDGTDKLSAAPISSETPVPVPPKSFGGDFDPYLPVWYGVENPSGDRFLFTSWDHVKIVVELGIGKHTASFQVLSQGSDWKGEPIEASGRVEFSDLHHEPSAPVPAWVKNRIKPNASWSKNASENDVGPK